MQKKNKVSLKQNSVDTIVLKRTRLCLRKPSPGLVLGSFLARLTGMLLRKQAKQTLSLESTLKVTQVASTQMAPVLNIVRKTENGGTEIGLLLTFLLV